MQKWMYLTYIEIRKKQLQKKLMDKVERNSEVILLPIIL